MSQPTSCQTQSTPGLLASIRYRLQKVAKEPSRPKRDVLVGALRTLTTELGRRAKDRESS